MRATTTTVVLLTAIVLIAAACSAPTPPLTLEPGGPIDLRVDATQAFTAAPVADGVTWSVDGIEGGSATVGTISSDGLYTAPFRIPPGDSVVVGAVDQANVGRSASADVRITAGGTIYLLEQDAVYVYRDADVVDGPLSADRTFRLDVPPGEEYYDMVIASHADTAFITTFSGANTLFRVPNVSSSSGVVTAFTALNDVGRNGASGIAYDPSRDLLYVRFDGAIHVYEAATTRPSGDAPERVLVGAATQPWSSDGDARIALDHVADRLFISTPNGLIGVYDGASGIDGDTAPDRVIDIDTPTLDYVWGLAYDQVRDVLYVADQRFGAAIYVIHDASSADGAMVPDRVLGGATNPLAYPSMISFDARNDRLAVFLTTGIGDSGVALFDDVSTLDGDVPPTRVVSGMALPYDYPYGGYLDPTQ